MKIPHSCRERYIHARGTADMPRHSSNRHCYKSAYRPRLTTIFLCLLGLALLPSALCCVGTENRRRVATTQEAVPLAVGFHLGQAYS